MSLLIDLPPDVESRLQAEATKQGLDAPDFARLLIENQLLTPAPASEPEMTWGEKVAATLKEIGPMWLDRPESSEELAAKLRAEAERRGAKPSLARR